MYELIDEKLLTDVSGKAKESSRGRMNHNFHSNLEAPVQKLLNALEPGTIVPIHRHQHTDESYIVLKGALKVSLYSDEKELILEEILDPQAGKYGLEIKSGCWHTLEVLESGTVIFEIKEGPYSPITEDDILELQ